ncbi:hypothetical protein K504DRAFT_530543 [Pleomassaria siparia CBS 279.74]|uniref:Uncharacterized protein n=1 Tax=Pleomassaria siparia CBS 279.74 TaxID=1314801 RepID=A0A6G1KMG3_9PLEO|nr:hypothetical protein K504DRAFT_530543 [Pleomassaria siparia CBS 279.74]
MGIVDPTSCNRADAICWVHRTRLILVDPHPPISRIQKEEVAQLVFGEHTTSRAAASISVFKPNSASTPIPAFWPSMDHLITPEAKGKGKSTQSSDTSHRSRTTTPNSPMPRQSTTEHYPDHGDLSTTIHGYPSLHTAGSAAISQQLGQYYLYLANTEFPARQTPQASQPNSGNQQNQSDQKDQNTSGK